MFETWAISKGIILSRSSAYNPTSNCRSEIKVREMKTLLKKTNGDMDSFKEAVAEYANCPSAKGESVNQLFYRRILRSPKIPSLRQKVDSQKDMKDRLAVQVEEKAKRVTRQPSPLMEEGDRVWLQDSKGKWKIPGTMQLRRNNNRSYIIAVNNALYLRNAPFL